MMDTHEVLLGQIATVIRDATEELGAGDRTEADLPSAPDLARALNLKLETVKKKLRILKEAGLIHPMSFSPKRYRFEPYALKHLPDDHPLYSIFFPEEAYS